MKNLLRNLWETLAMTDNTRYAFRYGTIREMESCLNKIGYKSTVSNHTVAKNLAEHRTDGVKFYTCRRPDQGFGVYFKMPPIGAILVTASKTIIGEL